MKLSILPCAGLAVALASCSGGGSAAPATPTSAQSVQLVTGTLSIGAGALAPSSTARRPDYVSTGTRHAAVFIDGATTPAGTTSTCAASTSGASGGCTISFSANVTVPAVHTFAVEIDSGSGTPANTVLAVGQGQYALMSGPNTLSPALNLDGVVAGASFTIGTCATPAASAACGNVTLADAAGFAIGYTGSSTTLDGQNPTLGNVYDNDGGGANDVTFTSSNANAGTVTGIAQSPFSTYSPSTLKIASVNASGVYTYSVACATGASGTFGLTTGGGTVASGDVTAAELSGLGLTYPTSIATVGTPLTFVCVAGTISGVTGTLPIR